MGVIDKTSTLHSTQEPRVGIDCINRIPPNMGRLQLDAIVQGREVLAYAWKMP